MKEEFSSYPRDGKKLSNKMANISFNKVLFLYYILKSVPMKTAEFSG